MKGLWVNEAHCVDERDSGLQKQAVLEGLRAMKASQVD